MGHGIFETQLFLFGGRLAWILRSEASRWMNIRRFTMPLYAWFVHLHYNLHILLIE